MRTILPGKLLMLMVVRGFCHMLSLHSSLGVDTDKYKYPIGSGRVTFNNHKSFMRAVNAAFIEVKTTKFTKKIQVGSDIALI